MSTTPTGSSSPKAGAPRARTPRTSPTGSSSKRGAHTADLPGMDAARIAVAHMVSNHAGRAAGVSGGALRCLLAFKAAADASGRFMTAHGENVLFWSQQYYKHIAALEAAGLVRRLPYTRESRRHLEVTASGAKAAAKVGRLIETAAKEFLRGSQYSE